MKTILLIDDHTLFREGVELLLRQLDDAVEVLSAGTCKLGLELAAANVDLVLLDLELPDQTRFEGLSLFRERHPGLPVVMMSARDDAATVIEALDRGAMGFIPKTSSTELMLNALRLVFAGGTYIPPEAIARHAPLASPVAEGGGAARTRRTLADLGLTDRQVDVLRLLVQGRSNKLICRELDLAEGTVKTHMTAVLRALHVTNRTQAIIAIAKLGITLEQPKAVA